MKEFIRRKKARENLADYASYVYDVKPAKHHRLICSKIEQVFRGEISRLFICAPPGSAKSTYSSVIAPSFFASKFPGKNIVAASHTAELATEFGKKVRNLVQSEANNLLFENVSISKDNKAANRWSTSIDSSYFSCGVGGSVTGRRADILIIDDPFRGREDAESPSRRNLVANWFFADAFTRLKPGGGIIIINTRWHEDDLVGRLKERLRNGLGDKYEEINLEAICTDPDLDPLGRAEGEALWPEWQSLKELNKIKSEIPVREWESLYQQNPSPPEGNLTQRSWIKTYSKLPEAMHIYQSWDTAGSEEEKSDPSVCLTVGKSYTGDYYLLDVFRKKLDFPELFPMIPELYKKFNVHTCYIEDKGTGKTLLQLYQNKGMNIIGVKPQQYGSKEFRFGRALPVIKSGRFMVPEYPAAWKETFIEEIVKFPASRNDDQVDAISQLMIQSEIRVQRGMRPLHG